MSILDATNRPVWAAWAPTFASQDCWTDRGERNAVAQIAAAVRNGRILDVGVGAGRSTWILQLLSENYVGIDYTPEMVALCQANHPESDIRLGDARHLDFPDGSFDFVVFSCNGLDAVSHDDRAKCIDEFRRVLRPGGVLLFSGLNKDGSAYLAPPWRPAWSPGTERAWPIRLVRFAVRVPLHLDRYVRSYRNWFAGRRHWEDHGSWGVAPLSAHDFGLLVHYATVEWQLDALAQAGFAIQAVWSDEGRLVSAGEPSRTVCHHFVAERGSGSGIP